MSVCTHDGPPLNQLTEENNKKVRFLSQNKKTTFCCDIISVENCLWDKLLLYRFRVSVEGDGREEK